MSYTPGPWNYEEPDVVGLPHLRAANGDAVATFLREPWNSSDIPLIAAAPELYEALVDLIGFLFHGKKDRQTILKATAALAKARGEEGEDNA